MYIVYMHINKVNNKKYIGITKHQNAEKRWKNGKGYDGQVFYKAVCKYGWTNFEHKVLIHGLTLEQACRWEIKLIKHYNTMDKRYGYNMTTGGEHTTYSSETKEKIRLSKLGENNPMYQKNPWNKGKKGIYSPETLKKMGSPKEKHPNWGKHLSPETRKKISDAQRGEKSYMWGVKKTPEEKSKVSGINHPKSKKVMCIETQQIFGSTREANKYYNTTHVAECCRGNRKTAAKLHWKFI